MKRAVTFPRRRLAGFALVEVVIALGIVSFSLVAIMGVMLVGLDGMKNSDDEDGAATAISQIAADIRNASTNATGDYVGLGLCDNLTWSLNQSALSPQSYLISLGGYSSTSDQRLVAHVEMTPPASLASSGSALISVAWPASAQWDEASKAWTHAHGSLTSYLVFLPRP